MNFWLIHFSPSTPYVSRKPRFRGYPATRIQSSFGLPDRPETLIHPPIWSNFLAPHDESQDLLYFCVFQLPPSLSSWTPMETVASWHGEVNYKRYQSLGVVGRLVGLGSTDSQLPLRADPRARAIAPSLSSSLYPSLSLPISLSFIATSSAPFYLVHRRPASFPPLSIFHPHLTSVADQDNLTPYVYNLKNIICISIQDVPE